MTVYATGIVALNGRARLLDVVAGRSATVLSAWVSGRDSHWRADITVAALDPFRGYATALHTSLPHTVRVLDAFHMGQAWLRRRGRRQAPGAATDAGHRGRKHDPLFGIRRLLRRGADHHSPTSWQRMPAGLDAGDDNQQIGRAWIAAQELRLLYREKPRQAAERRLLAWFTFVAEHEIPS